MRKAILILILVLMILGGAAYATYFFFFTPNQEIAAAFDESELNLVIEDQIIVSKSEPKIIDGEIMLPMETIKKYFDENIWWDDNLKKVTITTNDRVIRMKTDNLNAIVNNKEMELKIPVIIVDEIVYIPIEFLSEFYGIEVNYKEKNNVILIDYENTVKQIAEPLTNEAVIRKGRSIHFPILKKFNLNAENNEEIQLIVYEEYDNWYKVRSADGIIGYISKNDIVVKKMVVKKLPMYDNRENPSPIKGKLNLVWEMMYGKRPNLSEREKIDGLDVISPTWFQIANEKGVLVNRSDSEYVKWAHDNGYQVWALFSNDFSNPKMTGEILNNTDVRDEIIRQLLVYSSMYELDGINIDFENVNLKDKDALTQFVRELTPLLREQGLIVSIDVAVPDGSDNWSKFYDRKALGEVVDYVCLMTYDQHWSSSPIAGSTAQITWVEKNVQKVLNMVPNDKLVLGLPFYTRLWKEEKDRNGRVKVSNVKALTMSEVKKIIDKKKAEVSWDEESGQFYAFYNEDDIVYKIWVEDENSINLKSSLVQKYNLAGVSSWSKNFEVDGIWNVLNNNLKNISYYKEWEEANKGKEYNY